MSSSFAPISTILPEMYKEHKLEQASLRFAVISNWEKVLTAFVPKSENQTQAISFEEGTLTVACLSQGIAADITNLKAAIISGLNLLADKAIVKDIIIEI